MKTTAKQTAFLAGVILAILGVLAFVGCLSASMFIWTPGTPSPTAQALVSIAVCGLPTTLLGCFLATLD